MIFIIIFFQISEKKYINKNDIENIISNNKYSSLTKYEKITTVLGCAYLLNNFEKILIYDSIRPITIKKLKKDILKMTTSYLTNLSLNLVIKK